MKTSSKAAYFGAVLAGLGLMATCMAEDLPKSGTISIHTGWKVVAEPIEVGEKITQGHGNVVGVSFNEKGSGPLHGGPAICFFTFFARDGGDVSKGYCSFGDIDGDKIFTDWDGKNDGKVNQGINRIVGGTGKYKGITGSGPWKIQDTGPAGAGASHVTQRFDYKLP
ncbi:MAG: hypothetical protein ACJ8G2_11950 [Burkholderiales bacterium]|jgi:hypothetical protein